MIGYIYDEITKEYLREEYVQESPLEPGSYLIPPNCTLKVPKPCGEEQINCFIGNRWTICIDHRDHYQVNLITLEFMKVNYIGVARRGFQFVSDEVYEDYQTDPDKYKVVDGVFTDISDTEEYRELKLQKAKEAKYNEAKLKAYSYLDNGEALYEFEEGKHVEATDGNIAKFTAYALGFASGSTELVVWCTKEDETVFLNQEQVVDILQGLGAVQAQVWTVKFMNYVTQISAATTVAEVEAIVIDYSIDIENGEG